MKKILFPVISILIIVILCASTAVLAVKNNQLIESQKDMFRSCIESATYHFSEYKKTGDELQYNYGVNEIYSALTISLMLSGEVEDYEEVSLYINKCYGCLTQLPNESKEQLERLIYSLGQYVIEESLGALGIEINSFANSVEASTDN